MLFSTTAGAGHFGPLVPFATACRNAGHEAVVAAPASFAAWAELGQAAGLPADQPAAAMAAAPRFTCAPASLTSGAPDGVAVPVLEDIAGSPRRRS